VLGILFVALWMIMGLRQTAGDFSTYQRLFDLLDGADLSTSAAAAEPLYGFFNWLSSRLGLGIYGVNILCSLVFLYCLWRAAMKEATPLFFITLAVPYFLIVVGMGYTRQGVATALILLSIVQLREGRALWACMSVAAAIGFHFTGVVGVGFLIFATTRKQTGWQRWLVRAALALTVIVGIQTLVADRLDNYTASYIDSDRYESGGAFLRAVVTGVAAFFFAINFRSFRKMYDDYALWLPFAVLAVACVPLSLVASTPVDRLGLYLLPFQLIVFSRLPAMVSDGRFDAAIKLLVLVAYMGYFFVWLHFGSYAAELWVPYRWAFS
jgi:hypothetical protein